MASLRSGNDEARAQALELSGRTALPLTVRSLSEAEVTRIDGRAVPATLGFYLLFALPVLGIAAVSGLGPGALALAAAIAGLFGALLWLVARRRARARSSYRDPKAVLEIGPDSMILSLAGRVDTLAYADSAITLTSVRPRGATYFLGLVLETPGGPLRLEDLWFKPGRTGAAAVVGRVEAALRMVEP